jgi:hypothetical protein
MNQQSDRTNWNIWYAAVLGVLAVQIILYYFFTQYWS